MPHNGGEAYDQKPPLGLWLGACSLSVGGAEPSEFLVRLPGALSGVLAGIGVLLLGRLLFGGSAGLLAAIMFQTMWIIYWSGRFYHFDVPLTATVIGALYAWLRFADADGTSRLRWAATACLCLAVGVLIKGPPALVFPIGVLVVYRIASRNRSLAVVRWLTPVTLIAMMPAVVWFLGASALVDDDGAWAHELLVQQGLLRLVSEAHSGKHGFLYYPSILWGIAAPWSLFLPAALGCLWRDREKSRIGFLFCVTWFLVVFTILMCGASRRSRYLMPALPAMALLLGAGLDLLMRRWGMRQNLIPWPRWNFRVVSGLVGLVVGVAGVVLVFSGAGHAPFGSDDLRLILEDSKGVLWWGLSLLASASVLVGCLIRNNVSGVFWSMTAALCVCVMTWSLSCSVAVDRFKGLSEVREALAHEIAGGAGFFIAGTHAVRESTPGYYRFYLGRSGQPVGVDGNLLRQRMESRLRTVVLVTSKELARSPDVIPDGYVLHPHGSFARKRIFLYTTP